MIYLPLLSHNVQRSTIPLAAAKSVVGRRNPDETIAPTHALAWFFVGARTPFLGALLAYLAGRLCCVMVARAGQLRGWPVSIVAGIPTPVRATTMSVGTLVGSEDLSTIEAAIMATVPTPALPKIFTFLIQRPRACRLAELRRIRTIAIIANTEAQARANLPGLSLVFMSRTPSKGVAA
ncbi:ash family protein [Aeromonas allosaccharophila]|uniref:ash family protein n=1 Tax=Aeromonas allosaccharophila TaxID=656 RepID=UPI00111722CA|nr:ash family protein [Aeromonas allosaccharophila]TNI93644.1 hypothetical protein CF120_03980 [Aeromonas allosaccharophila]